MKTLLKSILRVAFLKQTLSKSRSTVKQSRVAENSFSVRKAKNWVLKCGQVLCNSEKTREQTYCKILFFLWGWG